MVLDVSYSRVLGQRPTFYYPLLAVSCPEVWARMYRHIYTVQSMYNVHTKKQNKNNTTTGRWSHRWSHPTGYLSSKILKLDDLYTFELSKCMFDCINCFLPTPILEHFRTNATIRAHHTRQRNIPHVTQTFGTISKRAVTHNYIKGQQFGQKYHKQSDYIKTRIPSLDY